MPSVKTKAIILSVVMLSVVGLNVVAPQKVVTKTGHHTQQQLDQILNKNKGISVENRPSYLWFKIAANFSSNFSAEKYNLLNVFHCVLFKC
jgi:hypothetical protein